MEAKDERRSVEVRGKNVEQAIEKGLAELGIHRAQAQITVIREGSRGVLGIGAEDAVVRVTFNPPPAPPRPAEAPVVAPQPVQSVRQATPSVPLPPAPAPVVERKAEPRARADAEIEYPPLAEPLDRAQVSEVAQRTLETLLDKMGISARVEVVESSPQEEEPSVMLNVTGDDLGVLIGRRGETLEDLQFILRLIVSRELEQWPNIIVDVEYYKARREKLLTDLARRMGDKVRLSKQPVTLEPMPANERRIIHLALRDSPGVFTESNGEGENRKVVILPKP